MPQPGPTSTAAPASPSSPVAATLTRSTCSPRRRPRAASTWSISARTRSSTAGGPTDAATRRTIERTRSIRTVPRSSMGEIAATAAYRGRRARLADRPHGLAVRAARQRLPDEDPCRGGARPGRRRTAPGRRRRVRLADLHARRCRRGRRAPRLGRRRRLPPRREWRRRLAGGLGAGTVQAGRPRCLDRRSAASTWPRASTPPAWGVLDPTPLPGGEPLRPWPEALADYLPMLLRQRAAARAATEATLVTDRPSSLEGVRFGAVTRHADTRGSFRELWRASTFPTLTHAETGAPEGSEPRFVQANLSTSATGRAARAPLPPPPARLLGCRVGPGARRARRRPAAALRARRSAIVETRELAADDWVVIPAGVAHGFLALEPLELLYLVTNEFDGTDELGFAWDDPAVGVPWPAVEGTPDGRPILSDRDKANPPLSRPGGQPPRLGLRMRAGPRRTATGATSCAHLRTGPPSSVPVPGPMGPLVSGPSRDCSERAPSATLAEALIRPPGRSARELTLRKSVFAVVLALVAMLGAYGPVAAAQTSTAKIVIIVGATHGETAKYRSNAERALRRGDPAHAERHQGLQPQRHLVRRQGGGGGREHRHLSRSRQWLAKPLHLRPQLHDQGRVRAQRDGRQRRLQQQVLRRAVDSNARPRPECDRVPAPPLLRVGQLGARRRRSLGERRPAARRQLRRRVPRRRRVGGHRRRPQPHRLLPAGPVHDRPATFPTVARCPELPRPRHHLHPDPKHRDRGPRPG